MKKYFSILLIFILVLIMGFIFSNNDKNNLNRSNRNIHNIASATTDEIFTLENQLNLLSKNEIEILKKYLPNISYENEISEINSYISEQDITNATSSFNNLKLSVNNNIDIIKNNFINNLNQSILKASGLSDSYLENLINNIETSIEGLNFNNTETKLSILSTKIDNLLYENGQLKSLDPLIIDGIIIVNKNFGLPVDFGDGLKEEISTAFNTMSYDAKSDGIHLFIASGFRDYNKQESLYDDYYNSFGEEAKRFSSPAGYSEHQTGLAIDIGGQDPEYWVNSTFYNTSEYKWLEENCYKYGFILRYPDNKEEITGYMFEPWHYRYVGTELSTYLTENNLTLEEHFNIQ